MQAWLTDGPRVLLKSSPEKASRGKLFCPPAIRWHTRFFWSLTCIQKKIGNRICRCLPPIPLLIRQNFSACAVRWFLQFPSLPSPSPAEPFLSSLSACFKVMNPNYTLRVRLIKPIRLQIDVQVLSWGKKKQRDQCLFVPHFVLSVIDIWFTLD